LLTRKFIWRVKLRWPVQKNGNEAGKQGERTTTLA
jgi:hypothetical protein